MPARLGDRNKSTTDKKTPQLRLERRNRHEDFVPSEPEPKSARFRLVAEFTIEADPEGASLKWADLTAHQRRFFKTALTVPEAFNLMCRLAIVSELESYPERYFDGPFLGPDTEDILAAASPFLSNEDREYWIQAQFQPGESLLFNLMPIFEAFRGTLLQLEMLDMTTGEAIPLKCRTQRADGA
jgi:hypothetical protein